MWDMRWYIANEALHRVGYNHLISYKHKRNNVFLLKTPPKTTHALTIFAEHGIMAYNP